MRIGAGVLNYRFWPGVRVTIDGLLAQTRRPDHILVVDHASGDGSADELRAAYPELEIVELEVNRGPAVGENTMLRMLRERDFDAIMPLPHDLELAPDALQQLEQRLAEAPEVGVVGPLIAAKHSREHIWFAGGYVRQSDWSLRFRDTPREVAAWHGRPPHQVDFLQTGGVLVRAEAAHRVGPVAEHFYYWGDDIDYTLRIAALGYRLECVPAAVGWQDFGDPPPYLKTRNTLLLLARNAPRRIVVREVVRQTYLVVREALQRRGASREELRARLRGVIDFCRHRWGPE